MKGAEKFRDNENQLDYLFLNNNYMPIIVSPTLMYVVYQAFRSNSVQQLLLTGRLENGKTLFPQPKGLLTTQGYGKLFAEHVLGHFILLQELSQELNSSKSQGMIIWTGSQMAQYFILIQS